MTINLLDQLASPENLLAAWRVVRGNIPAHRRKRSSGPDGITLAEYERDLDAELTVLRELLLTGRYQPSSPAYFTVPKPKGGQRMLAILPVQDRVAQRAALQMLEPFWEHEFLPCSFGFRPGTSVNQAVSYVAQTRRQDRGWVVDGDIQKCFDTIDHDLLMMRVKKKIADKRVLALLQNWLDVGLMQAGPPSNAEAAWTKHVKTTGSSLKRGWNWMVDAFAQESDPFARYNYGGSNSAEGVYLNGEEQAEELRQSAMKRVAASGMMFGVSLLRPTVRRLGALSRNMSVGSPAGRRIMKKGVLATGGFAGVAAAAAVATYFINQRVGEAPVGILQGSPLSPLLANIYLHPFDISLRSSGYKLARFADDWVILCEDQNRAENAYQDALRDLEALHLKVNLAKTRILPPHEKLEWLGKVIS